MSTIFAEVLNVSVSTRVILAREIQDWPLLRKIIKEFQLLLKRKSESLCAVIL